MPDKYTAEQKKHFVERNKKLVESSQTLNYSAWHTQSMEGYRFAHNMQLSAEELAELTSSGMPTFTINKMTPTIELARFFVTNGDPRWRPVGYKGDDSDEAAVVDTITERSWSLSDGRDVIFRVVTDTFTKSLGYFYVFVDSNMDQGKGEVLYGHINSWNVFVDPMSKNKLFKDAMWMVVKDDLSRSRLLNEHPDKESQKLIKKATSENLYANYFTYMGVNFNVQNNIDTGKHPTEVSHDAMAFKDDGSPDDILDRYRGFYRVRKQFWNVFINVPPNEQEVQLIGIEVKSEAARINEHLKVQFLEQKAQLDKQLENEGMIQERYNLTLKEMKSKLVKDKRMVYQKLLQEKIEQATHLQSFTMSDKELKVYESKGEFKKFIVQKTGYFEDSIEMIVTIGDHFISRTVMPGKHIPLVPVQYISTGTPFPISLASLLVGKQREMNKSHQLIIHNANLGSNLRWMFQRGSIEVSVWRKFVTTPGGLLPVLPGKEWPREIMPLPLSNAFVYLTEKASADFHFLSGMSAGAQGVENEQHETFKGQMKTDEMGTRRIRDWVHNMLDPSLTHLGRIYMDYAKELYTAEKIMRVHSDFDDVGKEVVLNQIKRDMFGNIEKVLNDISVMSSDIKIISGSTLPSNKEKRLENALIMRREGIFDDEEVIKETDIKDKKSLIERKTKLARIAGENKQLQTTIKELTGDIETLKRMVLTARLKSEQTEMSSKLLKTLMDAELRIKSGELKSETDIEKATGEYKNALKSMLDEAGLKIEDLVHQETKDESKKPKEKKEK